jgi:hypothetical protein
MPPVLPPTRTVLEGPILVHAYLRDEDSSSGVSPSLYKCRCLFPFLDINGNIVDHWFHFPPILTKTDASNQIQRKRFRLRIRNSLSNFTIHNLHHNRPPRRFLPVQQQSRTHHLRRAHLNLNLNLKRQNPNSWYWDRNHRWNSSRRSRGLSCFVRGFLCLFAAGETNKEEEKKEEKSQREFSYC